MALLAFDKLIFKITDKALAYDLLIRVEGIAIIPLIDIRTRWWDASGYLIYLCSIMESALGHGPRFVRVRLLPEIRGYSLMDKARAF